MFRGGLKGLEVEKELEVVSGDLRELEMVRGDEGHRGGKMGKE